MRTMMPLLLAVVLTNHVAAEDLINDQPPGGGDVAITPVEFKVPYTPDDEWAHRGFAEHLLFQLIETYMEIAGLTDLQGQWDAHDAETVWRHEVFTDYELWDTYDMATDEHFVHLKVTWTVTSFPAEPTGEYLMEEDYEYYPHPSHPDNPSYDPADDPYAGEYGEDDCMQDDDYYFEPPVGSVDMEPSADSSYEPYSYSEADDYYGE